MALRSADAPFCDGRGSTPHDVVVRFGAGGLWSQRIRTLAGVRSDDAPALTANRCPPADGPPTLEPRRANRRSTSPPVARSLFPLELLQQQRHNSKILRVATSASALVPPSLLRRPAGRPSSASRTVPSAGAAELSLAPDGSFQPVGVAEAPPRPASALPVARALAGHLVRVPPATASPTSPRTIAAAAAASAVSQETSRGHPAVDDSLARSGIASASAKDTARRASVAGSPLPDTLSDPAHRRASTAGFFAAKRASVVHLHPTLEVGQAPAEGPAHAVPHRTQPRSIAAVYTRRPVKFARRRRFRPARGVEASTGVRRDSSPSPGRDGAPTAAAGSAPVPGTPTDLMTDSGSDAPRSSPRPSSASQHRGGSAVVVADSAVRAALDGSHLLEGSEGSPGDRSLSLSRGCSAEARPRPVVARRTTVHIHGSLLPTPPPTPLVYEPYAGGPVEVAAAPAPSRLLLDAVRQQRAAVEDLHRRQALQTPLPLRPGSAPSPDPGSDLGPDPTTQDTFAPSTAAATPQKARGVRECRSVRAVLEHDQRLHGRPEHELRSRARQLLLERRREEVSMQRYARLAQHRDELRAAHRLRKAAGRASSGTPSGSGSSDTDVLSLDHSALSLCLSDVGLRDSEISDPDTADYASSGSGGSHRSQTPQRGRSTARVDPAPRRPREARPTKEAAAAVLRREQLRDPGNTDAVLCPVPLLEDDATADAPVLTAAELEVDVDSALGAAQDRRTAAANAGLAPDAELPEGTARALERWLHRRRGQRFTAESVGHRRVRRLDEKGREGFIPRGQVGFTADAAAVAEADARPWKAYELRLGRARLKAEGRARHKQALRDQHGDTPRSPSPPGVAQVRNPRDPQRRARCTMELDATVAGMRASEAEGREQATLAGLRRLCGADFREDTLSLLQDIRREDRRLRAAAQQSERRWDTTARHIEAQLHKTSELNPHALRGVKAAGEAGAGIPELSQLETEWIRRGLTVDADALQRRALLQSDPAHRGRRLWSRKAETRLLVALAGDAPVPHSPEPREEGEQEESGKSRRGTTTSLGGGSIGGRSGGSPPAGRVAQGGARPKALRLMGGGPRRDGEALADAMRGTSQVGRITRAEAQRLLASMPARYTLQVGGQAMVYAEDCRPVGADPAPGLGLSSRGSAE